MLVVVTETVEADLLEICEFLGPSMAGERFVADFTRQMENLRRFPEMGTPNRPGALGKRAVFLGRGEYVMTYEILDDKVMLRRIVHASRDPEPRGSPVDAGGTDFPHG